jgi:RNA polymerase sigma-70 factor, ECF subfamily
MLAGFVVLTRVTGGGGVGVAQHDDLGGDMGDSVGCVADKTREDRFREQVLSELEVVYRVARRLTRSLPEAEDLVQDTLLRAYRGFDGFDGRYPRAWLLTILRNTHVNRLRKRRPDLLEDELAQRLPASGADGRQDATAEQVLRDQFDPLVRDAVASLSASHRAVVALVDLDGLSYQEAADVLGVPVGTVMSRLHRARRKVRAHLEAAGFTEVSR